MTERPVSSLSAVFDALAKSQSLRESSERGPMLTQRGIQAAESKRLEERAMHQLGLHVEQERRVRPS